MFGISNTAASPPSTAPNVPVGIDSTVLNDFCHQRGIVFKVIRSRKLRKIVRLFGIAFRRRICRRNSAFIDLVDCRFRNRISIVAKIVFDMSAGIADMIIPDSAAILEANNFRRRAYRSRGQQER